MTATGRAKQAAGEGGGGERSGDHQIGGDVMGWACPGEWSGRGGGGGGGARGRSSRAAAEGQGCRRERG
eukprot:350157-Chlamydomonas_euryale.AAC.2